MLQWWLLSIWRSTRAELMHEGLIIQMCMSRSRNRPVIVAALRSHVGWTSASMSWWLVDTSPFGGAFDVLMSLCLSFGRVLCLCS